MPEAKEFDAAAEVRRAARELDHDRYLAGLLAPADAREGLLAIAAFHGEVARVPAGVTEPTIGAIRLQWWRDQLDDASLQTSPVVDALRRVLSSRPAALRDAVSMIDAYEELLHPGALGTPAAVDAVVDATQGSAFRLAARALGAPDDEVGGALIAAAAHSYGRVQLLRALPLLLRRGHNPFGTGPDADWAPLVALLLAEARSKFAEVRRLAPLAPATIRQAILPVALVEPYLKALEGLGSNVAFEQAAISPLSRVWRLFIAKRRRRF